MRIEKIYSNGLLKDAINSRSICTPIRFSHDRSTSGDGTNDEKPTIGQSTNATDGKVNYLLNESKLKRNINFFVCLTNFFLIKIPPPPTTCCMSGCANCVWIQYAEEVSSKLQGGSDAVREIIMKDVQDTNMRSFLDMELRLLKLKEKK